MFHYFTSIYSICLVFFLLFYRNTKSSILLAYFTSHYYCNKNTAAAYNAIIPGSPNSAPVPMDKILRLTGAVIPFRIQTMLIPYTIIAQKAAPSTTKPAATTTATNTTTVKAPAKTTVKLSKAKKTSIKVSWKKISGVAAYQIQYSTSKNFKKAKTVKVSAKSASKVLKKLKKNKTYYIRVRAYKMNGRKKVYGKWSKVKKVKIKK